eukprot:247088-Chlamydomonas_euryale.AAC.3
MRLPGSCSSGWRSYRRAMAALPGMDVRRSHLPHRPSTLTIPSSVLPVGTERACAPIEGPGVRKGRNACQKGAECNRRNERAECNRRNEHAECNWHMLSPSPPSRPRLSQQPSVEAVWQCELVWTPPPPPRPTTSVKFVAAMWACVDSPAPALASANNQCGGCVAM